MRNAGIHTGAAQMSKDLKCVGCVLIWRRCMKKCGNCGLTSSERRHRIIEGLLNWKNRSKNLNESLMLVKGFFMGLLLALVLVAFSYWIA